jgi:hypothetical protein
MCKLNDTPYVSIKQKKWQESLFRDLKGAFIYWYGPVRYVPTGFVYKYVISDGSIVGAGHIFHLLRTNLKVVLCGTIQQ